MDIIRIALTENSDIGAGILAVRIACAAGFWWKFVVRCNINIGDIASQTRWRELTCG